MGQQPGRITDCKRLTEPLFRRERTLSFSFRTVALARAPEQGIRARAGGAWSVCPLTGPGTETSAWTCLFHFFFSAAEHVILQVTKQAPRIEAVYPEPNGTQTSLTSDPPIYHCLCKLKVEV